MMVLQANQQAAEQLGLKFSACMAMFSMTLILAGIGLQSAKSSIKFTRCVNTEAAPCRSRIIK